MDAGLPYTTEEWPAGRPLYRAAYYKNESGIYAVVSDLHDTELFTISRRSRAAAYEAGRTPQAVDHVISREVVRRLEQEDWENDALYVLDDA